MKPDFEWWKRPESYVDTSPPLSDEEKAAEFKRVLNASNEAECRSVQYSVPQHSGYTITFPSMPDVAVNFRVGADGKVEASFDGFAEL